MHNETLMTQMEIWMTNAYRENVKISVLPGSHLATSIMLHIMCDIRWNEETTACNFCYSALPALTANSSLQNDQVRF